MRHPPLQAPLLWQVYLGFWIAGVAAAVWPLPALCCALLLALADKRLWRGARLTLAATLVLGGLAVARWQLAPPDPSADAAPARLAADAEKDPARCCGRVRDGQETTGQRRRL